MKNIESILDRFGLLILILIVIFLNLPFLSDIYVPIHDTLLYFEYFYFFYNGIFTHNAIPQWMPYEYYGVPAHLYQMDGLTPLSYLMIFLGKSFHVQNVLWLFKWAVIGEHIILAVGMYLLCRYFFRRKSTAFLLTLALTSGATSWFSQLCFDLRVIYLLPWTLWSWFVFLDHRKLEYFWLTALLFTVAVLGTPFYTIIIWMFIFAIIGLVYGRGKKLWQLFSQPWSKKSILLFLLFLIVASSFFLQLILLKNQVDVMAGSALRFDKVGSFLFHGGTFEIKYHFLKFLINPESPYYIGLFPFLFVIWAAFYVRHKYLLSASTVAIFLFWLSFGGFFSVLCYFIPPMPAYHHINFTYGELKIFLLLIAGFGLEHFWGQTSGKRILGILLAVALLIFITDMMLISGEWLLPVFMASNTKELFWKGINANWIFYGWSCYLIFFIILWMNVLFQKKSPDDRDQRRRNAVVLTSLALAFFIDIGMFHSQMYKLAPSLDSNQKSWVYTTRVFPLSYQASRSNEPLTQRQKDAVALTTRKYVGAIYSMSNSFCQFDMCISPYRSDIQPKGFNQFLKTRHLMSPEILKILGCGSPKLRLISNHQYFPSRAEATKALSRITEIFNMPILTKGNPRKISSIPSVPKISGLGTIAVERFSENRIDLNISVTAPEGTWLIYADSFHPGWKAKIDGKLTDIFEAYLFMKAVRIDPGQHHVSFYFYDPIATPNSYWIALVGFGAGIVLMITTGLFLFKPSFLRHFVSIPPMFSGPERHHD